MMTTDAQFEVFKKASMEWLSRLGIKSWHVIFTHDEDDENIGTCDADSSSRLAVLNFSSSDMEDIDLTDEAIKRTAFHEVCELLFWDIRSILETFMSEDVVSKKIHEVIRTLENMVLE